MYNQEDFMVRRFFTKYSQLVDMNMARRDPKAYENKLNHAQRLVKDIDFTKNLLIFCEEELAREVFLVGFSKMPYYCTYRFFNAMDITNIWFGPKVMPEDEEAHNNTDLKQDVLCITMNYAESKNAATDPANKETIFQRAMGQGFKRPRLNWVYFKGTQADFLNKYPEVNSLFNCGYYNFATHVLRGGAVSGKASSPEDILDLG